MYIIKRFIFLSFFVSFSLFSERYKIAFVKQVTYQDLYCCATQTSCFDLVFSTFKRTGPVALFSRYQADFFIVDVENEAECGIWKEKAHYCYQHPISYYESLVYKISEWGKIAGHVEPQGTYSIKCSDIDWSDYNIVISVDIAIPEKIVKKYPKILWCYFIGEGCQQSIIKKSIS